MSKLHFKYSEIKIEFVVELLHIDSWDHAVTLSKKNYRFFATIDHS